MYISKLELVGYKNCCKRSLITFKKGLNIIVGENASGKTTIINAIRMILKENEYSRLNIDENDFYESFSSNRQRANKIKMDLEFKDLNDDEKVTFLSWCNADLNGELHLEVENILNRKGYYHKTIWGGASKASAFEEETFDCIDCVYLPPLRDAEEKLTNGRKSRLAKLLMHEFTEDSSKKNLEEQFSNFNEEIAASDKSKEISRAKKNINSNLEKSMGTVFGQSINLQFADVSFTSILQNIKMVFFPELKETDICKFRDIAINSLGYNNLLYIATVFAELQASGKNNNLFTVLLIEEPEAHLHPQLQIKLIKYFEEIQSDNSNLQIIITTHSPVLASSSDLNNLIHIRNTKGLIESTPLNQIGLCTSSLFLNRWLDVTKSTLLFSRGIILVEGISESLLIPTLAKIVLDEYNNNNTVKIPKSLEEAGVSVVNIGGLFFCHFMKLFCNIEEGKEFKKIPIRCSGITDKDPKPLYIDDSEDKVQLPNWNDSSIGNNPALKFQNQINKSDYARLFCSPLKTFEYDLAMSKNSKIMAQVLKDIWPKEGPVKKRLEKIFNEQSDLSEEEIAEFILKHIDNSNVGKGVFAQELAMFLENEMSQKSPNMEVIFDVPEYLKNGIIWACGGNLNE